MLIIFLVFRTVQNVEKHPCAGHQIMRRLRYLQGNQSILKSSDVQVIKECLKGFPVRSSSENAKNVLGDQVISEC
jgi:hypothetical protein